MMEDSIISDVLSLISTLEREINESKMQEREKYMKRKRRERKLKTKSAIGNRQKDSTVDEILMKSYSPIRFEVPFNLECKGCHYVIAKGVRVNAIKEAAGSYRTREKWSYNIECGSCVNKIVMESNIQGSTYKVIKGARRTKSKRETEGADRLKNLEPWKKESDSYYSDRSSCDSCEDS